MALTASVVPTAGVMLAADVVTAADAVPVAGAVPAAADLEAAFLRGRGGPTGRSIRMGSLPGGNTMSGKRLLRLNGCTYQGRVGALVIRIRGAWGSAEAVSGWWLRDGPACGCVGGSVVPSCLVAARVVWRAAPWDRASAGRSAEELSATGRTRNDGSWCILEAAARAVRGPGRRVEEELDQELEGSGRDCGSRC